MQCVLRASAIAALAVLVMGCIGEIHPGWNQPLEPHGPMEMQEAVVYLDYEFEELVVLRSQVKDEDAHLEVERHSTGEEPREVAVSEDGSSLYVINRGDQSLSVFEIDEEDVERSDVQFDSHYDRITVDPEGEFVLLSNSGVSEDAVVQNLSELGVVDLRGGIPDEVEIMTLPTQASILEMMPSFEMGGEPQRLGVALATNEIAIVDFNAESEADQVRSVRLTTTQSQELTPREVVFDVPTGGGLDEASIFVQDDRGADITQIMIKAPVDENAHRKLNLSVNQLAAGNNPRAMQVLEFDDVGKRLLVLDGNSPRFTLVDIASGESATFDLPLPVPARSMHTYTVTPIDGQEPETRVLAYTSNSHYVAVIRPETITVGSETPTQGRTVEDIRLPSPPSEIIFKEGTEVDRAIVLHAGGNDGYSVLQLQRNRSIELPGQNLRKVVFDGTFAFGIFRNSPHIERFNTETNRQTTLELPMRGTDLFLSADKETVMVRHNGADGRFTVLDRATLMPEDARLFEQVFLNGVLDRQVFEEQ